ncbi:MAG: glutamate racemase [Cyanobacteria bacterium P01_F01_bin.150]
MIWHQGTHSRNSDKAKPTSTHQPIGVFDSGVGGLTVLTELQRVLPNESILYFGDTANLPYGTKTPSEILHCVRAILDWMVSCDAKMVIMACNTSSALALEIVRAEYDIPILGVILPAARAAVQLGERIGVIATPATAQSHAYRSAIQEASPRTSVWEVGCPEFVPLIEHGRVHEPETRAIVQRYLHGLIEKQIDTLVYGCTHYPYLSTVICDLLPPVVNLVNPAVHVVQAAKQEFGLIGGGQGIFSNASQPTTQFFVSDRPQRFQELAATLLNYVPDVHQCNLLPSAPLMG